MNHTAVETGLAATGRLRDAIATRIVGQEDVLREVLLAMLAGGHAVLVGVPGLAKTLIVRTLAAALDLDFRRIQFTPDLMPSDILGTEVLDEDRASGHRELRFVQGPIFASVILADEINRAPPRTQAALLEAMQEHHVTVAGRTMPLPDPFFVLATQNPIEQEGTYPLPEAQLDRFLFEIRIGYPSGSEEIEILRQTTGDDEVDIEPVVSREETVLLRSLVRQVPAAENILEYAAALARASRPDADQPDELSHWIRWGAGPRAGQALVLAAKASALLDGRATASIDDVRRAAPSVLRHRILLTYAAESDGITTDAIVNRLLRDVAPPSSGIRV